MIWPL